MADRRVHFHFLYRSVITCLLLAAFTLLNAQNILNPKWVANGFPGPAEHPKFSGDGSRVVIWGQLSSNSNSPYAWSVYNVSDGRVLATCTLDGSNGTLTGVVLSPDGGTLYYGTTTGIYAYSIANRTQVFLPATGASANNGAKYLDISKDGTTLAYILQDPITTDNLIYVYSLTSQATLQQIDIKNPATSNHTAALKFILNDTQLVVSGPTIYSVNGGDPIASGANNSSDVAVSPDGSMIFTEQSSGFSSAIYAYLYSASTLTKQWTASVPGLYDAGSVTSDGKALLFTGTGTKQWVVKGLATTTGTALPTLSVPRTSVYTSPYITAVPNSSQLLIGPEPGVSGGFGGTYSEPGAQVWTYVSSNGTGSLVGGFCEGDVVKGSPTIVGIAAAVNGQLVQQVVDLEYHYSGDQIVIRNASNGAIQTQLPSGAIVSPNGKWYAQISSNGLGIYNVSNATRVTSTTFTGVNLNSVSWGGNGMIAVTGTQNFGSSAGPYVIPFDGSNLSTTYQTFNFQNNAFKLSPDGTKIAEVVNEVFGGGFSVTVWDAVAGTQLSTISTAANSSGIDDITFSSNNLLGVHDLFNSFSSPQSVQYRVFNVSTMTPVLIRTILYTAPLAVSASGGGLSPDGQVIALGHYSASTASDPREQSSVRLYSVASGALLNQWDNQFGANFNTNYDPFGFTPDSQTVLWVNDTSLVAAPIVPFQMSLALNPTAVFGGSNATATVTVNPAQSTDTTFALSSASSGASVPATVTVPAGSTSASFTVTTQPLNSTLLVPITATFNGANASATLTINPYTVASLSLNPTTVPGGTSSTGTVTLVQTTGPQGAIITLGVNSTDAQVPQTVLVPGGANKATFTVTTNGVSNDKTVKVTASIGASQQSANLTITAPVLSSLTVSPTSVVGGTLSTGTVTLVGNAPAGGIVIGLTSSNSIAASVPQSVTVEAGTNAATFPITTGAVSANTTVTITATDVGNNSTTTKTATLTVQVAPLLGVAVSPTTVVGGSQTTVTGTVTLGGIAASAGDTMTLTSSNPSLASIPASVTVAGGATTATFAVTTSAVTSTQTVTITASFNGTSKTTTLTLNPYTVTSIALNPATVLGGSSSTGTVTISQAPANAPVTVTLSSGNKDAQLPASVSVPAGSTTATFTVTTSSVSNNETVTITAAIGTSKQAAQLTINAATLTALTVSPSSVGGGLPSTGTVTISQAAPTGGVTVTLSSDNGSATVPLSVTVAAGSKTATFNISTTGVTKVTTATITGTLGLTSQSAKLSIQPATIQAVTVTPSSVVGGSHSTATGTVTMSGMAAPGGDVITLSSSNPAVAAVPASVTVTGSSGSATFTVTTQSVITAQTVTITATFNGAGKTTTFTVNPFQISNLTITPSSVIGGVAASGTVTISQAAGSSGAVISLSSSSNDGKVPGTVVIAAGATSATFNIVTNAVASNETVTITATGGTSSKSATLNLSAPALAGLTVSPSSVIGGNSSTGNLKLTGAAPAGGLTVSLSSSNKAASVPVTVSIPGGSSTAGFSISTIGVSAPTTATISASLTGSTTQTATLAIQPPALTGLSLSLGTVVGGSQATVTGTVTLSGFAATGGAKITLASSNKTIATVPATVTVASGSSTATFAVTHLLVKASGTTTISATFNGVTQSAVLTVNPFQVISLTLSPTTVDSGGSSTGTVTLNAAPGAKSGAIAVKLTTSSKSATVPASVTVAIGSTAGSFKVTAGTVTATTSAAITGTYLTSSQQATLTIQPLPILMSVTVTPSSVVGSSSTSVLGKVTVSGPAPAGGMVVKLTSSNTAAATVPASVTIPAGSTSATFAVAHKKVTANKSVNISASLNSHNGVTTLTVTVG